jgi:cytochrome c oxidase assembly factor CtaG
VPAHLEPLTWASAVLQWRFDLLSAILIAVSAGGYRWCSRLARRSGERVESGRAWCFAIGIGLWALATMSMIGVYAYALFWVRALQVITLLFVAPFFIAAGKPLTVVRNGLDEARGGVFDRLLASRLARVLAHPLTTSVGMLVTPWLLYLTPWYTASLHNAVLGALTRVALVVAGFGYFYSRLQADPVPRRFPQQMSLLISVAETLGDGLLGLVIWQGPLIAAAYYQVRSWGPDHRLDQTIGAGVLWILGDVLGIPFMVLLMRALNADEKAHAKEVDAILDQQEREEPEQAGQTGLWWENDPELRDRFRRR